MPMPKNSNIAQPTSNFSETLPISKNNIMNYLHARQDTTPAPAFRPLPVLGGTITDRKSRSDIAFKLSVAHYAQAKSNRLKRKAR